MTPLDVIKRSARIARHRWTHLTTHPLTRDRPLAAVGRYVRFHVSQVVRPRVVAIPFVDGTHLLARRGVGGATDHLFVHLGDEEELTLLHHLLGPGDLFIDVGANVGAYTLLAASTGADVIACEPGEAAALLTRTIAENGVEERCRIESVAVGATEGSVAMTRGRDSLNRVRPERAGNTPMTTVDRLAERRTPQALKADVEGYEAEVIAGAAATLDDPDLLVVILELNGSSPMFGVEDADVHAAITSHGFRPHRYDPVTRTLRPVDTWNRDRFNTIYVRDVDEVRRRVAAAPRFAVGPHQL